MNVLGSALRAAVVWINRALALISAAGIVLIMVIVVTDVVLRKSTGGSLPGGIEYSTVLLVFVAFLGLGFAQAAGEHISTTILTDKLSPRTAAIVRGIGMALVTVVIAWMAWVSADRAIVAWQEGEARLGLIQVPVWPARIAVAVGLAGFLLQLIIDVADDFRRAAGKLAPKNSHSPEADFLQ
jgi:TRAP-type C4-dicarboxylate transport system permease small subunit